MTNLSHIQQQVTANGYAVVPGMFSSEDTRQLCHLLESAAPPANAAPRDQEGLYAIRRVLQVVPDLQTLVFNSRITALINEVFGTGYVLVKSIYFDKSPLSNWFVAFHQDLTIAVNCRAERAGFCHWTIKQGQFAVQPPADILQNNFTLRIHLDDTDEANGALQVLPGTHHGGIQRLENTAVIPDAAVYCPVLKGGVMLMRPLLFHASGRTTNGHRRRVLHLEFSKAVLPAPLQWAEQL